MRMLLKPEWLYCLLATLIIVLLLFTGEFIGVADNGDFLRIMGSIGLNYYNEFESYEQRFFNYAHAYFAYDSFFRGFYVTSQLLIVLFARSIAFIIHSEYFDIRVLGALYSLLLITASCLCITFFKKRGILVTVALMAILLLVFHDVGYLAYFNSLYGEPVSFIFMLLTLALGLTVLRRETPSKRLLLLFVLACLFLVCSKTQNAPLGLLFSVVCLRFAALHKDNFPWKRLAITCSAALVVIAAGMYLLAPKDFKQINLYQTVFFGILHSSDTVQEDLQELGLPAYLEGLAGTNYFQSDTVIKQDDPRLQADFYERISHMDVLLFYMKHPDRLLQRMSYAAEHSMNIRPYYLGTYELAAGKHAGAVTEQYSWWSQFKRTVLPNEFSFIMIVYLLYYGVLLYEWRRRDSIFSRIALELFGVIGLIGAFGFLIPIVGDGLADLSKHLFMFNVAFDIMLAASVIYCVDRLWKLIKRATNN